MTYFFFNLFLLPFYPAIALYTLWRRFGQKKSAPSLQGQWGGIPRETLQTLRGQGGSTPVIWIHAVSVGEQVAARPIARALKTQFPDAKIALTATTDTGFATAQNYALKAGEVDAVFYFPLDLPFTITRALNAIQPDVFIAVETELWPNFLHLAHKRGVLCVLANGRVSDNLLKRAVKTKWLWKWMISNLDALLMRADFDAGRMHQIARAVGAVNAENKIIVTGDVKLDGASELQNREILRQKWREELSVSENDLLVIFGSTHPGEEEIALRVFQKLRLEFSNLRLLIAPRHIERTDEVLAIIALQNLPVVRRSAVNKSQKAVNDAVILLDTVGELSEIYAAADVAFVGGSLIPRGGHNVLEPILRGVPVLFGPHMANFRTSAEMVSTALLGDSVDDEEQLQLKLKSWLRDETRRKELPNLAARTLAPHQGAPARIAEHIAEQLKLKLKNPSSKI